MCFYKPLSFIKQNKTNFKRIRVILSLHKNIMKLAVIILISEYLMKEREMNKHSMQMFEQFGDSF